MLKVGLTGGIGSGKTTICKVFELLGVPVFYADLVAKALMEEEAGVKKQVTERFGKEVYGKEGALQRNVLAGKVFGKSDTLSALNAIVHPAVKQKFMQWAEEQGAVPYLIKEAAILYEAGADAGLDAVIAVSAPEPLRILRVMEREGCPEKEVLRRMKQQLQDEEKIRRARFVIYNDEERPVIPQILSIHENLIGKANTRSGRVHHRA